MSELLRPEPPRTALERARELLDAAREHLAATVVAVAAVLAAAVVGVLVLLRPNGSAATPVEVELPFTAGATVGSGGTPSTTAPDLVVHVAGAVARPGLHRLASGARVADAIAAAGGLAPDADVDRLNLAAPVTDGSRIYVLRRGEEHAPAVPAGDAGVGAGGDATEPIDLNAATLEQLDALPGIGPATAKAILDHRSQIGRFRSVDELLGVRGIGPAKLDQIRALVRV